MPRIEPLTTYTPEMQEAAVAHVATGARMTNMKNTLAHDRVAFDALMQWYPLFDKISEFLGRRRAELLSHAISVEKDCLVCSTYFRRHLIERGEDPDNLVLDSEDELMVEFGQQFADDPHGITDELYAKLANRYDERQIVLLMAFSALMVATNYFNDALQVPLDAVLEQYR
jgi:alkylhydroperoxidase family enzyme